jgi:hypothetical protein
VRVVIADDNPFVREGITSLLRRAGIGVAAEAAPTAAGVCFGHSGFWGAVSLYCPRRRLVVSVTVNAAPPAPSGAVAAALVAAAVAR